MRLIKYFLLIGLLSVFVQANDEKININFKKQTIMDLVKVTSKILGKNILLTQNIKGSVDYISNKPVSKDELVKILIYVLESKGFTLVNNEDMLRIIKLNEGAKSNVPVLNASKEKPYYQMVTEIFKVHNAHVDYIGSKIRYLMSKYAKLVVNKESNTLVLTDFSDNIKTVKKVVSVMTFGAKKSMEVLKLKNIKALDAKKSLDALSKSVFNSKIETERVSIIANKDNNSIALVGSKKNIKELKKYILKVDAQDSLKKRVIEVYSLKNVEAKNVIKIIDGIIGKKNYLDANAKPLASVDEETNSIVIMGPSDEIDHLKVLISKLDKEKAQVYVQAKIIEVDDNKVDELGVKYGIFGGKAGSNGLLTFSSGLNGGDSIVTIPEGLDLKVPELSSGLALGASISLLDEDGALDIVSEPSILAINNKESSIYVGETISVKTSTTVSDGGSTNDNFKREDVGLTLKVKPRISNDNKVTLEINTILENVKTTDTKSGNADTTKKEVTTTAIVTNGESIILGGLIQDKEESTESKVPLLGDLPILGALFTHNKTDKTKRSLVIVVTPYIVPKSKDLTYIRNQLAELKSLEEKYLKKSLVRLKQTKIINTKKENDYDKQIELLDKEYNEIKEKTLKSVNDVEENKNEKKSSKQRHQEVLSEYFGQ